MTAVHSVEIADCDHGAAQSLVPDACVSQDNERLSRLRLNVHAVSAVKGTRLAHDVRPEARLVMAKPLLFFKQCRRSGAHAFSWERVGRTSADSEVPQRPCGTTDASFGSRA
jgi:hypothetical protein